MERLSILTVCFTIIAGLSSANVIQLGCLPGWYNWNGYCYYVENNKLVTRDNANKDCDSKGATLLQVGSQDEMTYVTNFAKTYKSDGFWTSLTDLRFDGTKTSSGSWYWGSYIPMMNYNISWESYPTSNTAESCGALNTQAKMTNWECSKKMGYICEITLTPTAGCPFDWMPTDNNCYLFSDTTDITKLVTWSQAQQYCAQQPLPPNVTVPAKLLTIDKDSINDYILGQMQVVEKTSTMFWTGLVRNGNGWKWYNNDLYNPAFIHWASEPDHVNGNEDCSIVKTDGKFSDQDCSKKFNYICRSQTQSENTAYSLGCGYGWKRAGIKCYTFYDGPRSTWQTARSSCLSLGGDLLKVQSLDEKSWLELQMETTSHQRAYWTGLNDQATEGSYKWADGSTANTSLVRWNQEPNSFYGDEDCAVIRFGGVWNDRDCTLPTPYICEYSNLNSGACPTSPGWFSRANTSECYYFSAVNDTLSWFEAEDACHGKSFNPQILTTLLAVNDQEEASWITMMLSKVPFSSIGYWTGLNDRSSEGTWTYPESYNNPPNMVVTKWNAEPSDTTSTENCVFMGYGARYFDSKCAYKMGYICERIAKGVPASFLNNNSNVVKPGFCVLLISLLMALKLYK